jgi:hypothetical protein
MGNKPQFTAQQFIDAIPGTGGIITAIARKAGCTWHTAKNYIESHPSVKMAYDAECEGILDLAEVKLIEAIKSGDFPAIKYILSTKGKTRGYVERQEVTGVEDKPITVKVIRGVSIDDL